MKKRVWLSYDLGVAGDYDGLYAFLANNGAKECGESVAMIDYEFKKDLQRELKLALMENVKITKKTRFYAFFRDKDGTKAGFIVGNRKQPPWTGYGDSLEESIDDD